MHEQKKDIQFYNIAHMANTPAAVSWALDQGANGIEADLHFDRKGTPTIYEHGGCLSDCTCNPLPGREHICGVVSRTASTPAAEFLRHAAHQDRLALHVVDSKIDDDVDQERAGRKVVELLEESLFESPFQGSVVVSVSSTKHLPYLAAVAARAGASATCAERIAFTFDGEGEDHEAVFRALMGIDNLHRVYGTGITVCLPNTYFDAIRAAAAEEARGALGLTYIWSLDDESSMAKYIDAGARGILTNMPARCGRVLRERHIPLAPPSARIPAATTDLAVNALG